jgi:glycerol-3-phosphate dehydrogenase
MPAEPGEVQEIEGVDEESREQLAGRYGHAAVDVLAVAAESPELARRVCPDLPDLVAEAPFAARREQTRSLADVMLRRTRLGLLAASALAAPGSEGAEAMARAMAPELGWDDAEVARQLEVWQSVAAAEGLVPGGPAVEREAQRA